MPIKNPIERKKYDKKYYQKNKDRRKEISKLWRENNRRN